MYIYFIIFYLAITMNNKKILLVEDNQQIALNIKEYLEMEDWREVTTSYNWEKWLTLAKTKDYDLILLDLMLPWIDWKTICRNIRKKKSCPIIIITAKSQLEDKLDLFAVWADDYLVKPFDLEELLARAKAVMKRWLLKIYYEYKDIILDMAKKEITKDWKLLHLTLKEIQILECLIKRKWTTISRTDLISEIWWDDSIRDADNKLDVYISMIRKKLGKDIIKTIKWYGYRIAETDENGEDIDFEE